MIQRTIQLYAYKFDDADPDRGHIWTTMVLVKEGDEIIYKVSGKNWRYIETALEEGEELVQRVRDLFIHLKVRLSRIESETRDMTCKT